MKDKTTTKPFYNSTIPSDWEVMEFGEFAEIVMGQSPEGNTYNQNGDGVALINGPTEFTEKYPVKVQWTTSPTKICREGDILLCVRGSSTGRLNIANEEYCIGRGVAAIRAKKNSNHSFLEFQIENIVNKILALTTGSTFPNINSQSLKRIKVSLPPLPEQKAIAHILSLMDTAINKNNLLIAKKELQKKWLMQNLLTGKKRLNGFKGAWKRISAGEIFESITVKGFSDEELLSATQDRGMIPRNMLEGRVTMPTSGTEGFKLIEKGDFVISLRSFQGGLEYSYYRGLVSPAYTVLKPKKKISDEFYKFYFKSYDFIGHLAVAVIGIRDGKQISYEDFCFVKIPYPSIEEQTAIAKVLQASDKEIQLLKTRTEKLREKKKGLMQILLTGKKRLTI